MTSTTQITTISTNVHSQKRGNSKLTQNILLVLLDNNADDSSNTIIQLRRVVNIVHSFKDHDECVNFLASIPDENVCLITSGTLGKHIVPCVCDMSQVISIFIFCENPQYHEQWTKDYPKIEGIFTKIASICDKLKQKVIQYEHDTVSISFMDTANETQKDKLDCSFMYTQLLKDTLLQINFQQKHIQNFIEYCRTQFAGDDPTLRTITELEQNYRDHSPIWWYTRDSFLYSMVNHVLRTMDVDMIVTIGFFLTDLHRHIAESHSQQFNQQNERREITLYRGQGLSQLEFDQLRKNKGGLIAFNNFLSTSMDRDIAFFRAESNASNDNLPLVGILFVITIDCSQSTVPFASVANVGYYQNGEEEILLSMHSVFRIQDVKSMNENERLIQVNLSFTNETDKDLQKLKEHIQNEIKWFTGWDRLSELLLKMGYYNKAQEVCQARLDQTMIELEKGPLYHQLGWIKSNLSEYSEALQYYEKSLEIYSTILPSDHFTLAPTYNNMGDVYSKMGDYLKALSYYEKDFQISQKSCSPNHPDLATSYSNMGRVYCDLGEYLKALPYFEKALEINKQSRPSNHPTMGTCYASIGTIYHKIGKYFQALEYYEKGLEIKKQSLPVNHPDLTFSFDTLGSIYAEMNEQSKALTFFEQSLKIRQQKLPSNHHDLSTSYSNIGSSHCINDEYSKALPYFLKSLEIHQQSLSPNLPELGTLYNNIANVYYMMCDDLNAKLYYEKSLEILKQTLSPNHHQIGLTYNNIALLYENMNDRSQALSFYQRALDIMQHSLPPDHPQIQTTRQHLERVKRNVI